MPPIYINTDNTDQNNKIYSAGLVGGPASEVEDMMQRMVVKTFEKAPEFTTNKVDKPKGYTLVFTITKFKATDSETSCSILGDILQYPGVTYSGGKNGSKSNAIKVMTGGEWRGTATASGKGRRAVRDCVEAIMESMVPKSFPVMKADMTRR